jgi:hypothetical protein
MENDSGLLPYSVAIQQKRDRVKEDKQRALNLATLRYAQLTERRYNCFYEIIKPYFPARQNIHNVSVPKLDSASYKRPMVNPPNLHIVYMDPAPPSYPAN